MLRWRSGIIVRDVADCRLSSRINCAEARAREGNRHVWIGPEGGIVLGLHLESAGGLAGLDQDVPLVGGDGDVLAAYSGSASDREEELTALDHVSRIGDRV